MCKTSVQTRGAAGGWVRKRREQAEKTAAKVIQKTAEKIAENEADRVGRLLDTTDRIIKIANLALDSLEADALLTGAVDTDRLRKIASTVKDVREIQSGGDTNDGVIRKLDGVLDRIGGNI